MLYRVGIGRKLTVYKHLMSREEGDQMKRHTRHEPLKTKQPKTWRKTTRRFPHKFLRFLNV